MIQTIIAAQTSTSANTIINADPPIVMTSTANTMSITATIASIVANIIISSPFIKGAVNVAPKYRVCQNTFPIFLDVEASSSVPT